MDLADAPQEHDRRSEQDTQEAADLASPRGRQSQPPAMMTLAGLLRGSGGLDK